MKSLSECRLYAFVDTAYLHGRAPGEIARQLCDGGADLIQLRAKQSSLDETRRMAETLLPITTSAGVALVINDHPALARQVGADYCHLGQEDFFEAGYTRVSELKEGRIRPGIGLSTHSPDQARRALAAGPDYIAIGPVFATPTKPQAPPVTLEYVRWAAANVSIPWFAIGGIHPDNLDQILAAGASRICVVSAILDATDIAQTCKRFKQALQ
ncbi:MAG TPA: thiamine phosphate synthase [Candidatus Limnocylindrales bacterium]|jgi:thiamine-phosphate pyrophosphorylase|nr:thiamine phosphate synthase [Candidatus Limnocylindrales bacterium]